MIRLSLRRSLLVLLLLTLAVPALAQAQGPYAPTPPTPGALYRDGQSGRYLLGGSWLDRVDLANVGEAEGWQRAASTAGWSPVTVPNAYNAGDYSNLSMSGYVGWYRRDFTLPASAFARYVPAADRDWILRFESVNYQATVWLNGRLLGIHTGAYLPFEYDLSGRLRTGVNRLVVRVNDQRGPADTPPGPSGGWWNFGGLLREVYLRAVQRADLPQVQVRPLLPCPTCAAKIEEQALVRNVTGKPQKVTLSGRYGGVPVSFGSRTIAPHATWTANATATIRHPQLWAPGHPYLYKATLTLSDANGRALSGYTTYSGIRSIVVTTGGRIELNGRLLDLRGASLHEQSLITGAALDPAQLAQLMGWVRELGADIIRAHYPLNPEILEMADRYGILVWDEVPVYQVAPQYLGDPLFLARAHSLLEQNILDNQNHPSILLWSIGNELATPATPAEASYIAGAVALAHKLDPTRPVGMAVSDWPGVPCQSAYGPLQVLGFNDYFGWFDAGGGGTDDRDALSPFLDSFRACYPKKAIFITEYGFEANRSGPVEERGTYQFQSNSAAFHLAVFASKPWLSGALYFALEDFAVRPNFNGGNPWPDPPFNQKGLVCGPQPPDSCPGITGNLKPAFAVVSSIYHSTMQIAPAVGASLRHGARSRRRS